jgi:hypothetical protein
VLAKEKTFVAQVGWAKDLHAAQEVGQKDLQCCASRLGKGPTHAAQEVGQKDLQQPK